MTLNRYLIAILLFACLILLGLIYDEEQCDIIARAGHIQKEFLGSPSEAVLKTSLPFEDRGRDLGNTEKFCRLPNKLLSLDNMPCPSAKARGSSKSCDVASNTRIINKSDVKAEGIMSLPSQATPLVVTCKIYHAVEKETDSRPFETADRSIICNWKLNAGKIHWLAVSRDLVSKFPMGCKVRIKGCGKWDRFIWTVHDKTNKSVWSKRLQRRIPIRNQIELLCPLRIKGGKWLNVSIAKEHNAKDMGE